eukprot:gb/GECG01000078.1/.p1 GENE.gb/GECG01000078.1/~~gb/GECG01000078.1/.p1  ORF type:complete len:802 (+),score=221.63 gb/GECG01000078.1/:1-2406(+)
MSTRRSSRQRGEPTELQSLPENDEVEEEEEEEEFEDEEEDDEEEDESEEDEEEEEEEQEEQQQEQRQEEEKQQVGKKRKSASQDDEDNQAENSGQRTRKSARAASSGSENATTTKEDGKEEDIFDNESEDEEDGDALDDGDDENLVGDEEDRARLEQMTEIEREEELYRRHEQRQKKKEHKRMLQQLERNKLQAQQEKQKREKQQRGRRSTSRKEETEVAHTAETEAAADRAVQPTSARAEQHPEDVAPKGEQQEDVNDHHQQTSQEEKISEGSRVAVTQDDGEEEASDEEEAKDHVVAGRRLRHRQRSGYESSDGDSSEEEGEWNQLKRGSKKQKKSRSKKASKGKIPWDSEEEESEDSDSEEDDAGNETDESLLDEEEIQRRRERRELQSREIDVEDIRKTTVSRPFLIQHVTQPYFADIVRGAFIRILLRKGKRGTYCLARVTRVLKQETPYEVGQTQRQVFKKLEAKLPGSRPMQFKVTDVSSQTPTRTEFHDWKRETEKAKVEMPTALWCQEKAKDIEECGKNHVYNDSEIDRMCEENIESLQIRGLPFISSLRESIFAKIEDMQNQLYSEYSINARDIENLDNLEELSAAEKKRVEHMRDQIRRLQRRIHELDDEEMRRKNNRTQAVRAPVDVNKLNEKRNAEITRKALAKEAAINNDPNLQAQIDADPFVRRRCNARILWNLHPQTQPPSQESEGTYNSNDREDTEEKEEDDKPAEKSNSTALSAKALSFEASTEHRNRPELGDLGNEADSILKTISKKRTSATSNRGSASTAAKPTGKKLTLSEYRARKGQTA